MIKLGTEFVNAGFDPSRLSLIRDINKELACGEPQCVRVDYTISYEDSDSTPRDILSELTRWSSWAAVLLKAARLPEAESAGDARRSISQLLLGLLPLAKAPELDAIRAMGLGQSSSSSPPEGTSDEAQPPEEAF